MAHHHTSSWMERTRAPAPDYVPATTDIEGEIRRQAFQHPKTSLGVAGHIVRMLGVFVPVLAGEFIESPQQYKKVVRLASIGTAMAYEGIHVYNESKRRHAQEARLAECHSKLEHCER